MITPTRRTPSFFSARAANGQITAPPSSVTKSRRFIWDIGLPPALASSVSLPQRQNAEEGVGSVVIGPVIDEVITMRPLACFRAGKQARTAAIELAPAEVTINAVMPGNIA